MQQLPKVKGHIIYGSAQEFLNNPLHFLTHHKEQLGNNYQFRLGPQKIYFFSDPASVKQILLENWEQYRKENGLKMVLGESLLTSSGEKWKKQRIYTQPFFTKNQLNLLWPNFQEINKNTILNCKLNTQECSLNELCVRLIYDLSLYIFFGIEGETRVDLIDSINEMTDFVLKWSSSLVKFPMWFPFPSYRKFARNKDNFYLYIEDIIQRQNDVSINQYNFYSQILKKSNLSKSEIRRQALTFFLAGFETTANALFWTIYLLLKNPDKMNQVIQEVNTIDLSGFKHSDEVYKSLPFTKACLDESMRLYPPSWFRSRVVTHPVVISNSVIPANSVVWISQYVTQRDSQLWKNPLEFIPERFLQDQVAPYSYFPFSSGKHACIGKELAQIELITLIYVLFKKYKISALTQKEILPKASITLRPSDNFLVMLSDKYY